MARVTRRLYEQVAERAGHRSEYCGLPQEAEVMDLTVDHVVPRADQGSTEMATSRHVSFSLDADRKAGANEEIV